MVIVEKLIKLFPLLFLTETNTAKNKTTKNTQIEVLDQNTGDLKGNKYF